MSHKLQAKNKKTGEIVEYHLDDSSNYVVYEIQKHYICNENEFNELYEVVEEKEIKIGHSHCKCMNLGGQCPNLHYATCSICIKDPQHPNHKKSEEETAEWEKEFDRQVTCANEDRNGWLDSKDNILFEEFTYPESLVELDPEKVKQFIKQTLEKEKDRIVREIEEANSWHDEDTVEVVSKEYIIKLIQNNK